MHLKTITPQSWQWCCSGCCLVDEAMPVTSDLEEVFQSELQVVEEQAFQAKLCADNERTLRAGESDLYAASIAPHQVVAQQRFINRMLIGFVGIPKLCGKYLSPRVFSGFDNHNRLIGKLYGPARLFSLHDGINVLHIGAKLLNQLLDLFDGGSHGCPCIKIKIRQQGLSNSIQRC